MAEKPDAVRRSYVVVIGAVLLASVVAIGGIKRWQIEQEKATWRAALPPRPNLDGWPAAFQDRIQRAETRMSQWPAETEALAELAQLYYANGFQKEAEWTLTALQRVQTSNPHWPHFLGLLLAGAGRLDEAIPYWEKTISLESNYLPAWLKLADALRKTNRAPEAAKLYEEVLKHWPGNVYAYLGLAVIDMDAGRWGPARERLEKAIVADATFSAAYSLLATIAERLGDDTAAQAAREKASNLGRFKDTSDEWSDQLVDYCYDVYRLQVISATLATTGNLRAALNPLQRAVELAPNDARTHRHLGKVYLNLKDLPNAQAHLERAVALQPNEPASYLELEKVFKSTSDLPAAKQVVEAGLKECPDTPGLHYEYALILVAERRIEESISHFLRARELAPEDMETYQKLATAYFRLGQEADGVRTLEEGLRKDPNHGTTLIMVARYYIQRGNASAAEQFLTRMYLAGAPPAIMADLSQTFFQKFARAPVIGGR